MILMTRRRLGTLAATALLLPLAVTACASGGDAGADGEGRLQVLASFYPLQFVAQQVGGDLVDVESLTPAAADPHHLELSPARTRAVGDADLVLFLSGFQTAVDQAIEQRAPARVFDAADHVDLLPATVTGGEHSHDHAADDAEEHSAADDAEEHSAADDAAHDGEHDTAHDEHTDEHPDEDHTATGHSDTSHTNTSHTEHTGTDHPKTDHTDTDHTDTGTDTDVDPHFWLDPMRLAQLADPVAAALAEADPQHAAQFAAGAADLVERLTALDAEMAAALAPFAGATLITNHTAFGYLAQRYGLEQVGIAGLDHDVEPSPARLREIGRIAREHAVTTLFSESLVSPAVIATLASDLGLSTQVLDTLEGLGQDELDAGDTYITVMQRNLQRLTEGLHTS